MSLVTAVQAAHQTADEDTVHATVGAAVAPAVAPTLCAAIATADSAADQGSFGTAVKPADLSTHVQVLHRSMRSMFECVGCRW